MTFSYKISYAEYRKLIVTTIIRRQGLLIATIVILGLIVIENLNDEPFTIWRALSLTISLLIVSPLVVLALRYFARSVYRTDKFVRQHITWSIDNHIVTITGESYNMALDLNSYYYIEEINDWFLFYLNSSMYHFVPKKVLTTNEIVTLRSTLSSLTGVSKVSLRKD